MKQSLQWPETIEQDIGCQVLPDCEVLVPQVLVPVSPLDAAR